MDITSNDDLQLLRLLQMSDSALPIGSTAHSFGLETLVDDGSVTVAVLANYLRGMLAETGTLEAAYCMAAHGMAADAAEFPAAWVRLNQRLDALKSARESRAGSAALGRRFVQLARDLCEHPLLDAALSSAKQTGTGIHHCAAFGLTGAVIGVDARRSALAYLNQSVAGLVSACQRLMPLGQTAASQLLWALKPAILEAVDEAEARGISGVSAFTALIDSASLRHPTLSTRLFIS